MTKKIDLTGHRYNDLTVLGLSGKVGGRLAWRCVCDCGTELVVTGNNLRNGHTKSCGCRKKAVWEGVVTTHGLSRAHPEEYHVWKNMRNRCLNGGNGGYATYGGRGVQVSPEWEDFSVFLADMGLRPGPLYSIERIDNDGPYSAGNCRWATKTEQANNRRSNRMVTVHGHTDTLANTARRYGLPYGRLQARLNRGEDPEYAIRN